VQPHRDVFRSATLAKLINHHQGLLVAVELAFRTGDRSRHRPNPTKRVSGPRQAYFRPPHGAEHPLSAPNAEGLGCHGFIERAGESGRSRGQYPAVSSAAKRRGLLADPESSTRASWQNLKLSSCTPVRRPRRRDLEPSPCFHSRSHRPDNEERGCGAQK
jgi:hypothetical protein